MAAHCLNRSLKYIGFGGTGKQVRDFLHIDDFCDLVLDQIANLDAYAGRHWNVGGGVANSLSLREATELCREVTGRTVTWRRPTRTGPSTCASTSPIIAPFAPSADGARSATPAAPSRDIADGSTRHSVARASAK